MDEIHQTDLATAQRKREEQRLAFLELKLQVLKAENERLKKRGAGGVTLPTPQERFEAIFDASLETAAEVNRWSLSRAAQAGLPSLGKRR